MTTSDAASFALEATRADASDAVTESIRTRVLDTLAAIVAGYRFEDAIVVERFSRRFEGTNATLLDGSGRTRSLAGATLANATAANVLDVDDGHRLVKGHPAAIVVPPAIAAAEHVDATVEDLFDAVYVGYELAVRTGLTIHERTDVYSGTGSWGAVGAAAAVCRLLDCDPATTERAIGIADYHAPRTPITRGVDRPGMTKDGVGWGAYVGCEAVSLAREGFTASGSAFDTDGERTATLYSRSHVTESYLKPYPCCRWAQPGVEAALKLRRVHSIDPEEIDRIVVETFDAATALTTTEPSSVAEAEYSYPYPIAATLYRGRFGPEELLPDARESSAVRALAERVGLDPVPDLEDRFPAECLARLRIETHQESVESETTRARGARRRPLSAADRRAKHRQLLAFADVDAVSLARLEGLLDRPETAVDEVLDAIA